MLPRVAGMDGLRLLELFEEYRQAREDQRWAEAGEPMQSGRPVEEIAADVEKTVRAILS